MNYTDTYFKILIRLPDEINMMKMEETEDPKLSDIISSINTVDAWFCIKDYKTITAYQEMYAPEDSFDEIHKKGFTCTTLDITVDGKTEVVLCSWNIKKFEEKLNAHVEKLKKSA